MGERLFFVFMFSCLAATVASISYVEVKRRAAIRDSIIGEPEGHPAITTSVVRRSVPGGSSGTDAAENSGSERSSGAAMGGSGDPVPDPGSDTGPGAGPAAVSETARAPSAGGQPAAGGEETAGLGTDGSGARPSSLRSEGSSEPVRRPVSLAQVPSVARDGAYVSGVPSADRHAPDAGTDGRSVFVPSRLGFPLQPRGTDVWSQWSEVYQRTITGTQGTGLLAQAVDIIEGSRMLSIAEDLVRRGVAVSFGDPDDFSEEQRGAVAIFRYADTDTPPSAPSTAPEIRLNPKLLSEHPLVLAAALVHEGTHLQQYLDGTLLNASTSDPEIEFRAWWNEAAFWEEVRGKAWPIDTPLERELEFSYRAALHGEARLRELLEAMAL